METTARTTFKTTREGLDHGLYPMRLFAKAKKLGTWDPAGIDLGQDAADWDGLGDREQDLLLRLSAQFGGGEESVTADLLPLLGWMGAQGRVEDELFLTSYLWEEAKHVESFDRFLREVARTEADLDGYLTPAYRAHFMAAQPQAMARLHAGDVSVETLIDAIVTYQMTTEGVLAETGYHAYFTVLQERGIMPGMQTIVQNIQRDEARHVGYGIYLLSELVAEHGDRAWNAIEACMATSLMAVLEVVAEMLTPYGDDVPFGLTVDTFIAYAQGQFQKRHARIEKARGKSLHEIRYGVAGGTLAVGTSAGGDGAA